MPDWHGIQAVESRTASTPLAAGEVSAARTDYERACNAPAFVSILGVGASESLVLANFTDNAAWLPDESERGGTIVRLISVDDSAAFEEEMRRLATEKFSPSSLEWRIEDQHLRLFSAASPGSDATEPAINIILRAGTYEVRTTHYNVPAVGEAIVHRVVPQVTSRSQVRESPPTSFARTPKKGIRRDVLQPGDILEIEEEGQYGYVAYVGHHFMFNDAVRVVPRAFSAPVADFCRLFESPGYVTFFLAQQAYKRNEVRKVGHCDNAVYPVPKTLRYASAHDDTGRVTLWNSSGGGIKDLKVPDLTDVQLQIPIAENWTREMLLSRIVSKWVPSHDNRTADP